ncbi:MAG: VOC family protein [Actinobacteria bacterium]|nr:VOC family protein [Actinomycetota bacterium]
MPVYRLNHAVLYVRDAERTATFYEEMLSFVRVFSFPGGVFLQAPGSTNDHDVAFFTIGADAGPSEAGTQTVGLYHLAWEVDTLDELAEVRDKLQRKGSFVGASDHGTTKALYAHDPDDLEFEVSWLLPADLIDDEARASRSTIRPLDLDRERQRYGGSTQGGVGVSRPAPLTS